MADDRTQFFIDILSRMTGGDTSIAQVTTLGDKMLGAKSTVADFERTIKSMSGALEQGDSAVKASSAALAEGEAAYKQAEIAADRAAKAVEKLAASGKSGDGFAKKQADAALKAQEAAAALAKEAAAVDALRGKSSAAAAQQDALSKGLKNVEAASKQAAKAEAEAKGSGKVNEMAEALGKLGGPAGVAGQKVLGVATGFSKLRGAMGVAGPYLAVAVAIIAIASAALFAAAGVGKWATSLADANRTQGLLAAGVARSVEGGKQLDATIERLGGVVPQTRDELLSMAGDLAKTGLRGKELTNELEKAAVKAAELKFGPEFGKQMLALDVQSKRFGSNLAKTFGGLNIEKLLDGVSKLVALFDSSTESGSALKFLFESMFQPLVDGSADAMTSVERLFIQAEILALKAYLALRPYSEAIALVAKVLLVGAAVVLGVFAVAIAASFGPLVIMTAAIGAVVFALYKLITAPGEVWAAIKSGFGTASTFLLDVGKQMIVGLVNGILAAPGAVVDAVKSVIGGAISGAEKLLKIGSPSKVFEEIGRFTSAGFAGGVDAGAGDAQGAVASMIAPPSSGGGTAGSGGGVTLSIGELHVHGADSKEQADDFIAKVTAWLEGQGLSLAGAT